MSCQNASRGRSRVTDTFGPSKVWEYAYIFQLQPSGTYGYTETTIYNLHTSTVLPDATSSGELVCAGSGSTPRHDHRPGTVWLRNLIQPHGSNQRRRLLDGRDSL